MRLKPASRVRLLADMELDTDPTGSTIEVAVDGTWYPATWLGSPVAKAGKWTQTARTTGYFAGPTATAAGAVVLPLGRHPAESRTNVAGDTIVSDIGMVEVK